MAPVVITISDSESEESPTTRSNRTLGDWQPRKQKSNSYYGEPTAGGVARKAHVLHDDVATTLQPPRQVRSDDAVVLPPKPSQQPVSGGSLSQSDTERSQRIQKAQTFQANSAVKGRVTPRPIAPRPIAPQSATALPQCTQPGTSPSFVASNTNHPNTNHPNTNHQNTNHPNTNHPNTTYPNTNHPNSNHPNTNRPVRPLEGATSRLLPASSSSAIVDSLNDGQRNSLPRQTIRPYERVDPSVSRSSSPPHKRLRIGGLPMIKPSLVTDSSTNDVQRTKQSGLVMTLKMPKSGLPLPTTLPLEQGQRNDCAGFSGISGLHLPEQPPINLAERRNPPSSHGVPYTAADNALLVKLKTVDNLTWEQIMLYFPGRSRGSLQVHWSTKASRSAKTSISVKPAGKLRDCRTMDEADASGRAATPPPNEKGSTRLAQRRSRRGAGPSVLDDFVSWSAVRDRVSEETQLEVSDEADSTSGSSGSSDSDVLATRDRARTSSLPRFVRQREIGSLSGSCWAGPVRTVPEEIKNHVFQNYRLSRLFSTTCGDVTCLAWSPDGTRFAAGSIAITDDRNQQYNSNLNLLLGDCERAMLQELPEHHIQRPNVEANAGNVNSREAMRASQDPRLFMTVSSVCFSPDGEILYSAGSDAKVRGYRVAQDISHSDCRFEIHCAARADLLSVSNHGLLATACHSNDNGSVQVFRCGEESSERLLSLSPSRVETPLASSMYPSAMDFGRAKHHSNLLLAGFSSDGINEERADAGETCLWDVETGQRITLRTRTCNVFDIAWNPSPSSASTAFIVACEGDRKSRGVRSVVQCYAPGQNGARQVLKWDCPAFDINDLIHCPYDGNLVAAGATDGKVYVWDKRFADRSQAPLHMLSHGQTLNVLDHDDRDIEQADTGVRFLTWGATSSRLYSGSSDGVVKVWNPYKASDNAHVKDAATFQSAIMSGAFSADHRDLLIGEECGRLNLLSLDYEDDAAKTVPRFKLRQAAAPQRQRDYTTASELLTSRQIEVQSMGDLPIRQAVQGPNYHGPYLMPTSEDWSHAQEAYERALEDQNNVDRRTAEEASQSSETAAVTREAARHVLAAQTLLEDLQRRFDACLELEPKAEANQRAFRKAEKMHLLLKDSLSSPTELCKLDCNYLPKDVYAEGAVPDSRRSEQRIPGAYRNAPRTEVDIAVLNCKEVYELSLGPQCPFCSKSAPGLERSGRIDTRCLQRLATIRRTFFDESHRTRPMCEGCSAPVRPDPIDSSPKLCVRCNFACWRCAKPMTVSEDSSSVECRHCGLLWIAGVLGYDIADLQLVDEQAKKLVERGNLMPFDSEMIHYHSLWQTESARFATDNS